MKADWVEFNLFISFRIANFVLIRSWNFGNLDQLTRYLARRQLKQTNWEMCRFSSLFALNLVSLDPWILFLCDRSRRRLFRDRYLGWRVYLCWLLNITSCASSHLSPDLSKLPLLPSKAPQKLMTTAVFLFLRWRLLNGIWQSFIVFWKNELKIIIRLGEWIDHGSPSTDFHKISHNAWFVWSPSWAVQDNLRIYAINFLKASSSEDYSLQNWRNFNAWVVYWM